MTGQVHAGLYRATGTIPLTRATPWLTSRPLTIPICGPLLAARVWIWPKASWSINTVSSGFLHGAQPRMKLLAALGVRLPRAARRGWGGFGRCRATGHPGRSAGAGLLISIMHDINHGLRMGGCGWTGGGGSGSRQIHLNCGRDAPARQPPDLNGPPRALRPMPRDDKNKYRRPP